MKRYSFISAYIFLMATPSIVVLSFVYKLININALLLVIFISFLVGGIFEIWAVRQGKKDRFYIWEYNPDTTLNKRIFGVEVEDMTIFLILTPVFIIAMWEAAKVLMSTHDIPMGFVVIPGILFVLSSYYLVYKLTNHN